MLSKPRLIFILLAASVFMFACKKSPKVIESKSNVFKSVEKSKSVINWTAGKAVSEPRKNFSDEVHKVVVQEKLMATRYVYLKVLEEGNEFWIATRKAEFTVGDRYFYRGGLLKKQFHSKEYDRTFDRIYLVAKLVPERHGGNQLVKPDSDPVPIETHSSFTSKETLPASVSKDPVPKEGTISIAELTRNPQKYEGQTVEITGKCVKVNPNIMGRNWLHIKDGSADDFDLVVTTISQVQEGSSLSLKATVVLNKDFGAGYTYDLILEDGILRPGV